MLLQRIVLATTLSLVLGGAGAAFAQQPGATESQEEKITRLVRELGDASFEKRNAAQKELEALGRAAAPALEKATQSQDPEVAMRATEALARVRGQVPPEEAPQAPGNKDELEEPNVPMPQMPRMPNLDEMMKEMEKELPQEFGEMFRQLFRQGQPGQEQGDEQQGRFRFQMRRIGPNGELETIEDGFDGTPPALGLSTGPANAALRAQLGIEGNEGLVVNRLKAGGWAERAGLKLYDVIAAIDGRAVKSPRDLKVLVEKKCKVELYRRAKLETIESGPAQGTTTTPGGAQPQQPNGQQQGKGRSF